VALSLADIPKSLSGYTVRAIAVKRLRGFSEA